MKCKGNFKSERDHPQKRGKSDDLSCVVLLLKVTKSPIFQLSYVLLTPLCTLACLIDTWCSSLFGEKFHLIEAIFFRHDFMCHNLVLCLYSFPTNFVLFYSLLNEIIMPVN